MFKFDSAAISQERHAREAGSAIVFLANGDHAEFTLAARPFYSYEEA